MPPKKLRGPVVLIFACLLLLVADPAPAAEVPRPRPEKWAQPVTGATLENFFKVSDDLYRSEQPEKEQLKDLQAVGIRTVISLRHFHRDPSIWQNSGITELHDRMNAGSVTADDLIRVLRQIRTASKPVLIHCWHGSDRTGFMVAGYRMVFQNWSSADAIEEMRLGGYGLHESIYPNLAALLARLDVASVRAAVMRDDPPDHS